LKPVAAPELKSRARLLVSRPSWRKRANLAIEPSGLKAEIRKYAKAAAPRAAGSR
jgi:hypothetical protein